MDNGWDSHPDAGPKEPTMDDTRMTERPSLKLAAWSNDVPKLPVIVREKFTADDGTFFTAWQDQCNGFDAAITRAASTSGLADATGTTTIVDPDWSVQPLRQHLTTVVSLAPTMAADFKSDEVSVAC